MSLEDDASAMYQAMLDAVAGGARRPAVEARDVIARHGLDPLAVAITGALLVGLETAAARSGRTRDALLAKYLDEMFQTPDDPLRDLVAGQVRTGQHPPITDPGRQADFLWALVSLDIRATIDAVSQGPRPPSLRAALEHRPTTRPIYRHVCTPDCVPVHEHPWLGCRGLRAEIRARRRRG